jgi:hypothetical protein
MSVRRTLRLWVVFAFVLFTATVLGHNWVYFQNYCFHTYDLGIYMEAVRKFSFADLNPYLTTFGTGFLNDHWHPALLLSKIPAFFMPLSLALFSVEVLFCLLTAAVPLVLVRKRLLDPGVGAVLSIFLLINRETLEALIAFPVHPAVWADFLLLAGAGFVLLKDGWKSSLLMAASVALSSFFGEQFAFSLVGLALAFLLVAGRRGAGALLLPISLTLAWFVFKGRESFVGPILHQSDRVALSPRAWFGLYAWDVPQAKIVLKFLLEMVPFLFLYRFYRSNVPPERGFSKLLLIGGIFGPLILGRVLSHSFGHQYSPLLICAAVAFLLIPFQGVKIPPKAVAWSFIAFFFLSFSNFERAFRVITGSKFQSCVHTPDVRQTNALRMADLNAAMGQILSSSKAEPVSVLATGNLVPNLLQNLANGQVTDIAFSGSKAQSFDWVVLEYGVCGDAWPWEEDQLERVIKPLAERYPAQVITKTGCLFFARGPIAASAIVR